MGLFDYLQFDPQTFAPSGGLLTPQALMQFAQGGQQQPPPQMGGQRQSLDELAYGSMSPGQPQPMNIAPQFPQLSPQASSAMAQAPQQQPGVPPAFMAQENPGFGDRLTAGLSGFANSKGLLPAISNLIGGMATGQRSDPQGMRDQNLRATYAALLPSLGPQKAMLATMNPEAGKILLEQALSNKEKYQKTGQDALGNDQYGFVNEREQTVNGRSVNAGSSDSFGAVDHTLKGDDYLKQYPPEVQSQVKDYVAGKTVPTGNPRRNNIIKQIASKYGQDTGVAVDDATFFARKQMRTQLSSSAPSSLGGQINIGNTAAAHLADLSQKALELGNYDMGFTWGTRAVNEIRGVGTEQAAKMEALKGAAQHYGQEITKFYAGSPGGVAERDRFLESINGAKSPKELAAILATEAELMHGRLNTLGDQIKGVLGPMAAEYPVVRHESEVAFKKIGENVSKLKGGVSEPAAAQSAPSVGLVKDGWRFKGGNPADKSNWEKAN